MFLIILNILKKNVISPNLKKKINIFLAKDLRQYRIDYINVINIQIGKNWILGNKTLDYNSMKILKIFKFILNFFFLILIIKLFILK